MRAARAVVLAAPLLGLAAFALLEWVDCGAEPERAAHPDDRVAIWELSITAGVARPDSGALAAARRASHPSGRNLSATSTFRLPEPELVPAHRWVLAGERAGAWSKPSRAVI